jgi:casein kinase II subunit alpha
MSGLLLLLLLLFVSVSALSLIHPSSPTTAQIGVRSWSDCAVVGLSGSLTNSALGATIDRHGTVIRVNWSPVGAPYAVDVGSRTDVVVSDTQLAFVARSFAEAPSVAMPPTVLLHAVHSDVELAAERERYGNVSTLLDVLRLSDEVELLASELVTHEERILGFGGKICSRAPVDPDLCLASTAFTAAVVATMGCRDRVTLYGFAGPHAQAAQFYFTPTDKHRDFLTMSQKTAASRLGVSNEFQALYQETRIEFQILALIASGRAPLNLWEWRRTLAQGPVVVPQIKFGHAAAAATTAAAAADATGAPPARISDLPLPTDPPQHHIPFLRPLEKSFSEDELPKVGGAPPLPESKKWRQLVRGFQDMEREFAKKYKLRGDNVKRLEGYMAAIEFSDSLLSVDSTETSGDGAFDGPPILRNSPLRIPVVPAEYESVADRMPSELTDARLYKVRLGDNKYVQVKELGHGTYGTAYLCYAHADNVYESAALRRMAIDEKRPLVLKKLKGKSMTSLARELQMLEALRGVPNALQLLDTVRIGSDHFGFVVPFTNMTYYRDSYPLLSAEQVREYMRKVLLALDGAHSRGIVHMDIKPINIFYDHVSGDLQLGDWGLSIFYQRNVTRNWRTMTIYWKAPEVFLGHAHYSYAVDIWSIGACFAGMIVGKYHFFEGQNMDQISDQWLEHLGSDEWDAFVRKYRFDIDPRWSRRHVARRRSATPWLWYIREENRHMISAEALDLAARMLRFDPAERITAREALRHPYFDPAVKASTIPRPPNADPYNAWEQKRKHNQGKAAAGAKKP